MSSGNKMPTPSEWFWMIVGGWFVVVVLGNLGGCSI
jgi:hypothetical protein